MSEELTTSTAVVAEPAKPEPKPEYYLIARDPAELASAHVEMRVWARGMVEQMKGEAEEHRAAYDIAKKNRWSHGRMERLWRMAKRRLLFYEKTLRALEEGYLVVPNFQMDTFAVRTDKRYRQQFQVEDASMQRAVEVLREQPKALPAGAGEYVNPVPHMTTLALPDTPGQYGPQRHWKHMNLRHRRPIEFPVALAKSAIMSDGAKAAARKVFDELGVAHDKAWASSQPRKG